MGLDADPERVDWVATPPPPNPLGSFKLEIMKGELSYH